MSAIPDDDTDSVDLMALMSALAECRTIEPARRGQLDAMIEERGWLATAQFASYSRQIANLALRPWQCPPAAVCDEDNPRTSEEAEAAVVLRRLLELGLSRYEPNPLEAIAAAEERVGSPPMPETEAAAVLLAPRSEPYGRPLDELRTTISRKPRKAWKHQNDG